MYVPILTWIDNTLVIVAANGDASKLCWGKLNTANMSIMAKCIGYSAKSEVRKEKQQKFSTSVFFLQ